jgi:hypothetical protein
MWPALEGGDGHVWQAYDVSTVLLRGQRNKTLGAEGVETLQCPWGAVIVVKHSHAHSALECVLHRGRHANWLDVGDCYVSEW